MLLLVSQKNSSTVCNVTTSPFLIGKNDGCSLRIQDPLISSMHAVIMERNGRLFLFDLQSKNGTFVVSRAKAGMAPELQPVFSVREIDALTDADWEKATELHPGMQIAFACEMWLCRAVQEGADATPSLDQDAESGCKVEIQLEVLVGPEPGRIITIGEFPCVIGRSGSKADIAFLEDVSVSRAHARLHIDEKGCICLEDMGSRNGTLINGRTIQGPVQLRRGDRIQLSKHLVLCARSGPARFRIVRTALIASACVMSLAALWGALPRREPTPDSFLLDSNAHGGSNQVSYAEGGGRNQGAESPAMDDDVLDPGDDSWGGTLNGTNQSPLHPRYEACLELIAEGKSQEALQVLQSVVRQENGSLTLLRDTLQLFVVLMNEIGGSGVPTLQEVDAWSNQMAAILRKADRDVELIQVYDAAYRAAMENRASTIMQPRQTRESALEKLYRLRVVQAMQTGHDDLQNAIAALEQDGRAAIRMEINRANQDYHTRNNALRRRALETYRELLLLCDVGDWTREFIDIIRPWAESEIP